MDNPLLAFVVTLLTLVEKKVTIRLQIAVRFKRAYIWTSHIFPRNLDDVCRPYEFSALLLQIHIEPPLFFTGGGGGVVVSGCFL